MWSKKVDNLKENENTCRIVTMFKTLFIRDEYDELIPSTRLAVESTLAILYTGTGNMNEAVAIADRVLNDAQGLFNEVNSNEYKAKKKPWEIKQEQDAALYILARSHYVFAYTLSRTGDFDRALEYCSKCCEMCTNSGEQLLEHYFDPFKLKKQIEERLTFS